MATYYVELDGGQLQADAALKGGTMSAAVSFSGAVIYPSHGGGGGGGSMQTKSVSYTPSETAISASVTPDPGYDGLDRVNVSVDAISPTYVGSGVTRRSSSDLTASGATVTAPAGYYESAATKTIPDASPLILSGLAVQNDGTVEVDLDIVNGGYIPSQSDTLEAGTLAVKPAQTYTPGTTDQTIASGQYLTGAQTILGDANLLPENIKKDVTIFGKVGTYEGGGGGNHILMEDFIPTRIFENPDIDFGSTAFSVINGTASKVMHYFFMRTNMTSLKMLASSSSSWSQCNQIFSRNESLKTVVFPNLTGTQQSSAQGIFQFCTALEKVDWSGSQYQSTFSGCSSLKMLVIRASSARTLNNINVFTNTPFASKGSGGTLYVPESLVATYQSASNWSTILGYANNSIKSIESTHTDPDAPIDLTLYYVDGSPIS